MTDLRREYHVATDDEISVYVDKPDIEDESDYAGGTYTQYSENDASGTVSGVNSAIFSHPDQSEYGKLLAVVRTAIQQEIARERKAYDDALSSAVRVTTNLSGEVSFARYSVVAGYPIQICREKRYRGDVVIVNFTDPSTVYIGSHPGVIVGGSDTAAIVGSTTGTARRIRTKRALWAIATVPSAIDVQEEFD